MSCLDESARGEAVAIEPLCLKVRCVRPSDLGACVPGQAKPAQAIEDAGDQVRRRPLLVRVFDAKQEGAFCRALEPVEQCVLPRLVGYRW